MSKRLLVATHLQNFYPSSTNITTHAVQTSRRDIPLAEQNFDLPDSHATYSSVFSSHHTGDILLRVVQSDLAVELISLSSDIPPVRFVFPARVLPSPSLVVWHNRQLHLIVVTSVNSLYRIILPISDGVLAWHDALRKDWCREWQVKKLVGSTVTMVHVQDFYSVVLSLRSGSIIRLDTDFIEGEYYNERWNETEYTIHNWYSSLLPVLSSSHMQSSQIITLASLPAPSEITDVFSLSRDYVLRRWTIGRGCKAEIALTPALGIDVSAEKSTPLLEEGPRRFLQVFTKGAEQDLEHDLVVLVFVPTPTSAVSGGYFQTYLFPAKGNSQWELTNTFVCSETSVQRKLNDFILYNGSLFILWENQGSSFLETTLFDSQNMEISWKIASYQNTSEMNQVFIDELLMQPGSIPDKFMQAIFKPGVFSPSTIRTAIREYTSHHLALEGSRPAPLLATYTTLSENVAAVVGCTIELTYDPITGLAQYKQYWNALRRDWEGFVAHCRVFERSARWPSALGINHNGQVIVIERERIAQCVEEDTPVHVYRCLKDSSPIDMAFSLMDTSWTLRTKLSRPLVNRIESEILNVLHQELAFPLADIIIEASNRAFSRDDLDEGLESWVLARLSIIEDFDQVLRTILDVIGGLEGAVKQEEDEVELILPPPTREWQKGLICAYISESVEARYELCLTLLVLLFFLGEDVSQRDPAVLLETFAVFRGIAMLQFLCRQPAGDLNGPKSPSGSHINEDVISRFSTMNMSHVSKNPSPTYSLIYCLLTHSSHGSLLPAAAHVFLDQSGLFSTITPAYATKSEILISARLRTLGYRDLAQEILSWLPRTPAVSYSLGRLWLETGRGDDSVLIFQGVAGCFGPDGYMNVEDRLALSSILPTGQLFPSDFEYYLHIAELFRATALVSHDVFFTRLAISVAPNDVDTADLWANAIKGYVDLNLYEEAYSSLCTTPYEKTKQRYISQLVYKMCENDAVELLTSMNFSGMTKEVEDSLSFKTRNADPRLPPYYAQILYTWYIKRRDYQNAASTMYIRIRKLAEFESDPSQLMGCLEAQLEGLVLTINVLSILDSNSAWITVPFDHSGTRDSRKRRKLNKYIQDDKFLSGQRDVDVLSLSDLQQEYALLVAKIEIARRDISAFTNAESLRSGWVVVSKLTQSGLFDLAIHTARALAIDMSELFQRLALQCIRLSSAHDPSLLEISSDWLLTDKVSTWPGTPADRGWRYLRQSLERHDSAVTDFKYSKAVFETLLSNNAGSPPPPWLVQSLEKHHPDHLIRACLRFNLLEEAISHTLSLLRKANSKTVLPNSQASQTWVPYTLADAVLKAVETDDSSLLPHVKTLRETLSNELSDRISRMHRQSGRAQ